MSEKKQCQCYTAVQIGTCDEDCDRMTAKKQTAVMWLIEQQANMPNLLHGHPTLEEYQRVKEDIINKALQMEREQIEEAYGRSVVNEQFCISITRQMKHLKHFEKWFNKKFGWFFTNGHKYSQNPDMYN